MRYLPLVIALVALLVSTVALAGPNSNTTLVLHAFETTFGPCEIDDPCPAPLVNVPVGGQYAIYLVARNYDCIAGVQTAFDFGGFLLTFGLWDCQANQVSGVSPAMPGGATAGTIATAFDVICGGESAVIGRVHMIANGGCVTQVDSSYPFGTHVGSGQGEVDVIDPLNRGSVCVDAGGYNACDPAVPVEATTWGVIKAHYQQ